eukprot:7313478-Alexandrium_andersonii.AAC.1
MNSNWPGYYNMSETSTGPPMRWPFSMSTPRSLVRTQMWTSRPRGRARRAATVGTDAASHIS